MANVHSLVGKGRMGSYSLGGTKGTVADTRCSHANVSKWKEIMFVDTRLQGKADAIRPIVRLVKWPSALHQPAKKVLMGAAADAQAWEAAVALLDAMRQAGGAMVWDDE